MAKQSAAPAAPAVGAKPAAVPQDPQVKPKKSKKKLMLAALVVLLLGGGGAGAFFAMQPVADENTAANAQGEGGEANAHKKPPVFLNLENFVVNLRDEDSEHYLQLGVVLEASNQAAVDEMKVQMPRIRNGILLLLSSKGSEDLSTLDGKQKLMQEIVVAARAPMPLPEPNKGIEGVYFSAFVIQ